MKPLTIAWQKFGRLTAQRRVGSKRSGKKGCSSVWEVICDCGTVKTIIGSNLVSGEIQSCGCLRAEKNSRRLPAGVCARNTVFAGYKRSAREKQISWGISLDAFVRLTTQPCFYCGCEPSNEEIPKNNTGNFRYNGLDRVDNDGGYVPENVVPCCWTCNSMKRTLSKEDFLKHIDNILCYQEAKTVSVEIV